MGWFYFFEDHSILFFSKNCGVDEKYCLAILKLI
jgi:hypothetical protein